MPNRSRTRFRWLMVAFACSSLAPLARGAASGDAGFDALVDEYYAGWLAAHPSSATDLGLHQHDGELEDASPAAVAREVARLERFAARFDARDGKRLSPSAATDLLLVKRGIAAELLEWKGVQSYRHRADAYSGLASESVYVLIKRAFAPEAVRLAAVAAREEKIPSLLRAARGNLADVPRVNVDIALEELPGIEAFFHDDVPAAFPSLLKASPAPDPKLKARFEKANREAIAALAEYGAFLSQEVRPRAVEKFAIGEKRLADKLRAEQMVDQPIDQLLRRGEAELARLQGEFRQVAASIDPHKPWAEVQRELTRDHPAPEHLIEETQARLAGLRRFLVERDLVTLPSERIPKVEETPAFMRATTMASMFTPGPFETRATESMYNVTLPEPGWSKEKTEDFLRGAFSRPLMDVVSIHEAFPGHFTQFLWSGRLASKVRRFTHATSNSEGWAHYCEQMMLDEGYGGGDAKLRLAQLQDALLRAARFVVAIRMHARGMTLEQGIAFFREQGYQSAEVARMEARRGTEDPTYLVYTLGKLEILRLRDDYRHKLGGGYSIKKFHDAFLAQGTVPLPIVRGALLGE